MQKVEEAWRVEEAQRAEEEHRAEMARQAEAVRQQEEAKRQKVIDEARAWMEQEQQEEMQAWVQAITVTQGGGTPEPSTMVAVPILRACKRCTVQLGEPKGERKTSAEMHGQAEDGDNNERIALRQREVQEGAYDNRGGRG